MQNGLLVILGIYGFIITVVVLFVAIILVYNTRVQDEFITKSKEVKETVKKPFKPRSHYIKCPKCDKKIDNKDLYCRYCGKKIAKEKA